MTSREVLIVAGEVSGDMHAGNMLAELRRLDADVRSVGPQDLQAGGVEGADPEGGAPGTDLVRDPLAFEDDDVVRQTQTGACQIEFGTFEAISCRGEFGLDLAQFNKVQGLPFGNDELIQIFKQHLG